MIADNRDTFEVVGGVTVCTRRATLPSVRAKLLMWKAGLAGLVLEARAIEDDDECDQDATDPASLSDDELFAAVKRQARR
jgi:hypothetical protein